MDETTTLTEHHKARCTNMVTIIISKCVKMSRLWNGSLVPLTTSGD